MHTVQYSALTSDGLFVCRQHILYAPQVGPADYVKHTDLRHKQEKYGESKVQNSRVEEKWSEKAVEGTTEMGKYFFFKCMCE